MPWVQPYKDKNMFQSSHCGAAEINPTSIREVGGLIPGLTHWVGDPALSWLWCRPVDIALIWPLAWEPPYAVGVPFLKKKKQKNIFHHLGYFMVILLQILQQRCSASAWSSQFIIFINCFGFNITYFFIPSLFSASRNKSSTDFSLTMCWAVF